MSSKKMAKKAGIKVLSIIGLIAMAIINLVPFIFGAVACTFGKGDLSFVPLCWVSIVIGILTAFLTGVVIEKTKPKQ